jgi:hypothetical protein
MMWGTSTWSLDGVHPTAKLGPCNDRWMVAYPRGLYVRTAIEA